MASCPCPGVHLTLTMKTEFFSSFLGGLKERQSRDVSLSHGRSTKHDCGRLLHPGTLVASNNNRAICVLMHNSRSTRVKAHRSTSACPIQALERFT